MSILTAIKNWFTKSLVEKKLKAWEQDIIDLEKHAQTHFQLSAKFTNAANIAKAEAEKAATVIDNFKKNVLGK